MTTKIDDLNVVSLSITSMADMIIPTASVGNNSLLASSIGFMTSEIAAMNLSLIAQLSDSNTWNSITASSITSNSLTNSIFNLCMNNSNIVCNPTITSLTINNTLTSLSSVWSKMVTSSTKSKVLKGFVTLVGGTATVIYGVGTFSENPTVIATASGTNASVASIALAVLNQTTSQVTFSSSTNLTMSIYYIIFGS
jgi:hypothetical protein